MQTNSDLPTVSELSTAIQTDFEDEEGRSLAVQERKEIDERAFKLLKNLEETLEDAQQVEQELNELVERVSRLNGRTSCLNERVSRIERWREGDASQNHSLALHAEGGALPSTGASGDLTANDEPGRPSSGTSRGARADRDGEP